MTALTRFCVLLLVLFCATTPIATLAIDEVFVSANECLSSSGKSTGVTVSTVDSNVNLLTFAENKDDNIFNPERGWMVNVHVDVPAERNNLPYHYSSGRRLALALFLMKNVQEPGARISSANLADLTAFLNSVRSLGMKAVFRAAYDFNGQANPEPKDMADILAHQEQIAPILHTYKDVVFHVQTGMFGPWGEMHSSRHVGTPSRVADITRKWLQLIPAEMGVSLRTPALMKSVIGLLKLSSGDAARIGFYNDCLFGSASDYDTYNTRVTSRKADLLWLQNQTRVAMMGGETCPPISGQEEWSAPSNAIPELIQLHTSYLNRDWFPPVYVGSSNYPKVIGWKNRAACDGSENGYDYVSKRLGYRYVLKSGTITRVVPAGGLMHVVLKVQNIGFSAIKSTRTLQILLSNGVTTYKANVKGDPRFWERESGITNLNWYLRLPQNISPGTWNVDLSIPDPASNLINNPKYSIQFANLGTWQGSTGSNRIHTITVVPPNGNSVAGSTLREVDPPAPTTLPPAIPETSEPPKTTPIELDTSEPPKTTPMAPSNTDPIMTVTPIPPTDSSAPPSMDSTAPSVVTEAPISRDDFFLATVSPPVSVATTDAPMPLLNNNTLVWRSLSLSSSPSGEELVIGLASFVNFSLNRKVEIYVFAEMDSTPAVTLKGNKVFIPTMNIPVSTVANPPSGLEMSIKLPLSMLPSKLSLVRLYALNTETKQRMPTNDGSFLNLTLPVFAAHVRFTSVAPDVVPTGALIDTGAAASDALADFNYGWSKDNSASSSSCIAFSDRTWAISIPVSSFYRVRARLAAPSTSTCVGISMKTINTTLGVACDGSSTSPVILEQTVFIAGKSLRLSQAANQSLPLPLDNTQLCELVVSIATGFVLHQELSVAMGVDVNETTIVNALAALTGEASNRFGVLSLEFQASPARQDKSARVNVTYLVADEWLTSSSVPAAVVSSTLLSASADQWASVSPYTPVSSAVVSQSGPVPTAYVPVDSSKKTSSSSGSRKAVLIGVITTVVIVAAVLAAVAVYLLYPVPIWKRKSGLASTSSADLSSPVTSTTALAPEVGSPAVPEMRPDSSSSLVIRM